MDPLDVFNRYGAAVSAGDMTALTEVLSPDVVWHQPGGNPLSGDHTGPSGVVALLGRFMELSGGTFALEIRDVTVSGALVSATVRFTASREGRNQLDQRGVDVFRVVGDRITEVWLIGEDQRAEDSFWA